MGWCVRFYRHLAWGRHTSTQLHEVYRQHSHNPQVCSTILTLYTRHKDMLTRHFLNTPHRPHSRSNGVLFFFVTRWTAC